ncbi:hydrogenase nickel incorporation protein HypB [Dictyobacter alpinus]|uniref:Hydrogenase nickel incorporation protein HypB n=1 Tax=Dictyobacter alpinus TaxID=2014873 RepID=A0A402BGG5_9CHLR|nr:hydrogenase nickel incorporation protein HypB [Dictyobacter alpinus]GCE30453.1 hydrogenase nickel incorporation protein HypB [Dictyobacter alpinus]
MHKVPIVQNILAANERIAHEVHQRLAAQRLFTINMMSSAGAGKTTLLEQTIKRLDGVLRIGVIEGDVETCTDAVRIEAAGAQSVQIITEGTCHLEANMVLLALDELILELIDLLFIENVGNLVCPAGWQLGEDMKMVVVSTTEGDDKPAKYPAMFAASEVMVINKIDLLPYVDYDVQKVKRFALAVNPQLQIFELSCRSGEGLDTWCDWLQSLRHKGRQAHPLPQRIEF